MALAEGQQAPDFTLPVKFKMPQPDTISLSSYQGKQNALLLFYVLDWSPG
jgi:peroxiredoxin